MSGRPAQPMAFAWMRNTRGMALVEFALALPVLLVLYVGGTQLMDKISCSRKITIATRAIGDLVSQNVTGSTTTSELDTNLQAASQVMAPYPASKALIRVTEITTNGSGVSTVVWSRALNGTAYKAGVTVVIPAAMRISGTYFIFSEVQYAYTPFISYTTPGTQTLSDSIYMLPRNNNSISCTDCPS